MSDSELDPQVEHILDLLNDYDITLSGSTVEEAREHLENMTGLAGDEPEEVERVDEIRIEGPEKRGDGTEVEIPVRVYEPHPEDDDTPAVVFFHGGGFVVGSVDTHDNLCRMLANRTGYTVFSVEYRLAPEHPFPAAVKDAYAATRWVSQNSGELGVDGSRVAVTGDSAGGNLSAVVSLMSRDRGLPDVAFQALLYPVTAYMEPMDSRRENATGYFLESKDMLWFADKYLKDEIDARHPYAFPLQARDLSDLPPAFVLTCEFDPLRDEGIAYADRLRDAGVEVTHTNYDGMVHGFLNMEGVVDRAYDGVDEVAERITDGLEG